MLSITPAISADRADILALQEEMGIPTSHLTPELLRDFLVVREQGRLIGVGSVEWIGPEALLRTLAVSESTRERGIGTRLLDALEDSAYARGARRLYLVTKASRAYFASRGYTETVPESTPAAIQSLAPPSSRKAGGGFMVKPLAQRCYRVLFLGIGNSGRSLLAEAILNQVALTSGRFKAFSAGSRPLAEPDPKVLRVLQDYHIPTEGLRAKSWIEFAGADSPPLDFVITVSDKPIDGQPQWPGQPICVHWGAPDPIASTAPDDKQHDAFIDSLQILRRRLSLLTALPLLLLDNQALEQQLKEIGKA